MENLGEFNGLNGKAFIFRWRQWKTGESRDEYGMKIGDFPWERLWNPLGFKVVEKRMKNKHIETHEHSLRMFEVLEYTGVLWDKYSIHVE